MPNTAAANLVKMLSHILLLRCSKPSRMEGALPGEQAGDPAPATWLAAKPFAPSRPLQEHSQMCPTPTSCGRLWTWPQLAVPSTFSCLPPLIPTTPLCSQPAAPYQAPFPSLLPFLCPHDHSIHHTLPWAETLSPGPGTVPDRIQHLANVCSVTHRPSTSPDCHLSVHGRRVPAEWGTTMSPQGLSRPRQVHLAVNSATVAQRGPRYQGQPLLT